MLNRRRLLTVGGLAGGALVLPMTGAFRSGTTAETPQPVGNTHAHTAGAAPVVRPTVTPFTEQMPRLPVARPSSVTSDTDNYAITVKPGTATILPDVDTPVLTYGGDFLAPVIRARTGRRVRATFHNQLDHASNVHLHGGLTRASDDGHPMDLIAPGASRTYEYQNAQRGAPLWYHDHSHHTEAEHVYQGLAGMYLLEDPVERYLGLPSGEYDVPIMLRDAQFDADGGLVMINPFEPYTLLANGKVQPYFPVAARKYRFRLLNAALEYTFTLTLDGAPVTQVGSDGGLLDAPVSRTKLTLTPGERVDLVVDFGNVPVGGQVMLTDATNGAVLRFDVTRGARDNSDVPPLLRPLPAKRYATTEREVVISTQITDDSAIGLINGKPFDPDRIDFQIKRNTTEIWRIVNGDGDFGFLHNLHTHLVHFRTLDRDGAPPTVDDAGLKDTIAIPAGESVRVQLTFPNLLGRYMFHCHFLAHSAIGMMAQMEIVA
ncbi:multicopper oxidase family protein [Actinophytocola sediminis]